MDVLGQPYASYGINVPPNERWPTKVFKFAMPDPPPFNPDAYTQYPYDPIGYPAGPFTPDVLRCPSDFEPFEAHTYVLNSHLAEHGIKAGNRIPGGLTVSEVIMAGEKVTTQRDYYMQHRDYDRVVERFRHGAKQGSNYLYCDSHVDTVLPPDAKTGIDPWDPLVSTTQPSGG
jgi:prepilin-type processing-associated H-X9-DG protein